MEEKLKELFSLYKIVEIKAVPIRSSYQYSRIMELITEILDVYRLLMDQGHEHILTDLYGTEELTHSEIDTILTKLDNAGALHKTQNNELYEEPDLEECNGETGALGQGIRLHPEGCPDHCGPGSFCIHPAGASFGGDQLMVAG